MGEEKAERVARALFRVAQDHLSPELCLSLFASIPGASDMALAHRPRELAMEGIEGMMAEAMRSVFGVTDPLVAALSELKNAGLSSSQALQAGFVFMSFVGDKAGKDLLKQMADEIPGLSRLH